MFSGDLDPGTDLAEPNQLRIRPCPGREALRRDMEALEQIRLAGAVRSDRQDEPLTQAELEARVRAVVAERELLDDQPARRIGMIRYEKSSPSPWMTAGRSGLMSFRRTSSPSTESIPSRRNSGLKPISSGSPV